MIQEIKTEDYFLEKEHVKLIYDLITKEKCRLLLDNKSMKDKIKDKELVIDVNHIYNDMIIENNNKKNKLQRLEERLIRMLLDCY